MSCWTLLTDFENTQRQQRQGNRLLLHRAEEEQGPSRTRRPLLRRLSEAGTATLLLYREECHHRLERDSNPATTGGAATQPWGRSLIRVAAEMSPKCAQVVPFYLLREAGGPMPADGNVE